MALQQGLHQKLLQKLSPQQIQLMKPAAGAYCPAGRAYQRRDGGELALEQSDDGMPDEFEVQDEFADTESEDTEPDGSEESTTA